MEVATQGMQSTDVQKCVIIPDTASGHILTDSEELTTVWALDLSERAQ